MGSFVSAILSGIGFHFRRYGAGWLILLIAVLVWGWIAYDIVSAPPDDFQSGTRIVISSGETPRQAADALQKEHLISHSEVFYVLVRVLSQGEGIRAGVYVFPTPETAPTIAWRLIQGKTGITDIKITFPEGESVREMSEHIEDTLPTVSHTDFARLGKPYEGYLFPDTYLFAPQTTASAVIGIMRKNFDMRVATLTPDIAGSGHTLGDIVTMASLIEKEARTTENRRIISGILWRRIELHMPLQVDAMFGYIFDRDTYSPSFEDLKIDSPYNTYTHQGLPPTPINNPGLDALSAALYPTKTDYLYYLTDADGVIHYAKTFAEHRANREKYLK